MRFWRLLAALMVAACFCGSVQADYLSGHVEASCDPALGRGLIRFGYADADAEPYFRPLPNGMDHGLESLPRAKRAKRATDEIACRYAPGKEIKVRLGNSPYGSGTSFFSAWVDGVRVEHGAIDDQGLPVALMVDSRGVTTCRMTVADNAYNATAAVSADPLPLVCDGPHKVQGRRDRNEYPLSGRPAPRAGTTLLTFARDATLCKSLVAAHPPDLGQLATVVPDAAWERIDQAEGLFIDRITAKIGDTKTVIYRKHVPGWGSHPADRDVLLIVDASVAQSEVKALIKSTESLGWKGLAEKAHAQRWQVIGGPGLGINMDESTADIAVRESDVLVLLQSTESGENGGGKALLRVAAPGRSELLCRLRVVPQHF